MKPIIKHNRYIQAVFSDINQVKTNSVIELDKDFITTKFEFSNNEFYLVCVGKSCLKIIDTRTSQIVFVLKYPIDDRVKESHSKEASL